MKEEREVLSLKRGCWVGRKKRQTRVCACHLHERERGSGGR